jgi:hypothetical protein
MRNSSSCNGITGVGKIRSGNSMGYTGSGSELCVWDFSKGWTVKVISFFKEANLY